MSYYNRNPYGSYGDPYRNPYKSGDCCRPWPPRKPIDRYPGPGYGYGPCRGGCGPRPYKGRGPWWID